MSVCRGFIPKFQLEELQVAYDINPMGEYITANTA